MKKQIIVILHDNDFHSWIFRLFNLHLLHMKYHITECHKGESGPVFVILSHQVQHVDKIPLKPLCFRLNFPIAHILAV